MKDQWYADNRDLVKWAALVHLARSVGAKRITQVAFYRADETTPELQNGDGAVPLPIEVMEHFRDVRKISGLAEAVGLEIEVIRDPFCCNGSAKIERQQYFAVLRKRLAEAAGKRKIVFLDPDTGIAGKYCGPEHVSVSEISSLFNQLESGDCLAVYQHAARRGTWVEDAVERLATATDKPTDRVKVFRAQEVAWDVVLLAVQKE